MIRLQQLKNTRSKECVQTVRDRSKRVRKFSLPNECIKEESTTSSYSISPVKRKKKRAVQRRQYHRGPLLFSKVRTTLILNLPFSYNGIFSSEYFQDQLKVTLSFKTEQYCTDI